MWTDLKFLRNLWAENMKARKGSGPSRLSNIGGAERGSLFVTTNADEYCSGRAARKNALNRIYAGFSVKTNEFVLCLQRQMWFFRSGLFT